MVAVCTTSYDFWSARNSIAIRDISTASEARTYSTLMPVASVNSLNSGSPSCSLVDE